MRWTFWLNMLSPHLSVLVRALAAMPHQTVTVVAEGELTEQRKAIGWGAPDCSPARVVVRPKAVELESLIGERDGPAAVHILGGLQRGTLNRQVFPRLAQTEAMLGLLSESGDNRGLLGLARRAKYYLDRPLVAKDLGFILAMGQLGVGWFEAAGYDAVRIFPFAYVTERPVLAVGGNEEAKERGPFRILYLGRILRLKDGITAIRALQRMSAHAWRLDVIGDGPDLPRWEKAAAESGVSERISFRAAVDYAMIGGLLQNVDLLLQPSRADGWGAVVNEALMSGVPVICSDNCGAADLLREPWRGSTFKAGSVESLRRALQEWIERGRRTQESSARLKQWSSVLEGPQVAQYLAEIVAYLQDGGQRPSPPWY
jgi:glycosyltransferase involved in cell wall biosynthesis